MTLDVGCYYNYFCCNNLWKQKFMALENLGNLSPALWPVAALFLSVQLDSSRWSYLCLCSSVYFYMTYLYQHCCVYSTSVSIVSLWCFLFTFLYFLCVWRLLWIFVSYLFYVKCFYMYLNYAGLINYIVVVYCIVVITIWCSVFFTDSLCSTILWIPIILIIPTNIIKQLWCNVLLDS